MKEFKSNKKFWDKKSCIIMFLPLMFLALFTANFSIRAEYPDKVDPKLAEYILRYSRPSQKNLANINASLSRRIKEYNEFKHLPIIAGGMYCALPTVHTSSGVRYERHHLISSWLLNNLSLDTFKAPAILIPYSVHICTGSYGRSDNARKYRDMEFQIYGEAGGGLEGLTAVLDYGIADLQNAFNTSLSTAEGKAVSELVDKTLTKMFNNSTERDFIQDVTEVTDCKININTSPFRNCREALPKLICRISFP